MEGKTEPAIVSPLSKGPRVHRISLTRLVRRWWMGLVAVLVIALAGFMVFRLHGIFGSNNNTATPRGVSDEIVPFNPKRVVLEVFGPPGTVATISYVDVDAQPQQVDHAVLPWSYDKTTTDPAVFVNVMAQGNSDSIGCRITIDDVVKDERSLDTMNAYTYCLDKSG
jgi:hypothetical protein